VVPISVDATNMIVINVPARGRDPDHRFRVLACTQHHALCGRR